MKKIFKYKLAATTTQELELPVASRLLTAQCQEDDLFVWADGLLAPAIRCFESENEPSIYQICTACGQLTRITTAGCDHCDLEDK